MKKWEICKKIHKYLTSEMKEDDLIALDIIMNTYHQNLNAEVINLISFSNKYGMILPPGTKSVVLSVAYNGEELMFELVPVDTINDINQDNDFKRRYC